MAFKASKYAQALAVARRGREEHRFWEDLDGEIKAKSLRPNDFSIRELFEAFVEDGREIVQSWSPRSGGGASGVRLSEASIDTSDFSNITGQIVFSAILEGWNQPEFIGDRLMETVQTDLSGEKIPGISGLGDYAETVDEGKPYPKVGLTENWVETPETTKRGFVVELTKESIFFDRTGILLRQAGEGARYLGINREKRMIDAALGMVDLYKRNGATTAVATYGDNSGSHNWDNLAATNALVDWTDIENAMLLFDGMTDPDTGEPIVVMAPQLVVPSALSWTARRILGATELRYGDGAANTTQTVGPNFVPGYELITSPYVKARTSSASTWFLGDFRRAFRYMQNWPITPAQLSVGSEAEFYRDIVQAFKVSERGSVACVEPRYVVKCTS